MPIKSIVSLEFDMRFLWADNSFATPRNIIIQLNCTSQINWIIWRHLESITIWLNFGWNYGQMKNVNWNSFVLAIVSTWYTSIKWTHLNCLENKKDHPICIDLLARVCNHKWLMGSLLANKCRLGQNCQNIVMHQPTIVMVVWN